VERIPDAVPLGVNGPPEPGLEDRARQVLEEERGILRCVIAELLKWRGQGSAAAVSPDFIRAASAVASSRVRG
jgi:hypothetical protein